MQINRKLCLVFEAEGADGAVVHVHSAPIARMVFEQYYRELGQVFTQCFAGDDPRHVAITAPQLALPALKAAAGDRWDAPGGVKAGLINEIARNTTVAFVGEQGWDTLPLSTAITRGIIDDDGEAEILGNLTFFTAVSKVGPRPLVSTFLEMAGSLRGWTLTSSDSTAWSNSLPTLTAPETSTATGSQVIA